MSPHRLHPPARRPVARRLLLTLVGAAVALAPLRGAGAADHTVEIKGLSFIPEEIAVATGDSVTWVNEDEDDHDLGGGPVDSPVMKTGERFTYTFSQPGDVEYRCKIHTYMTGIVHVTGEATGPPTPEPTTAPPAAASTTSTTVGPTYPPLGVIP